MSATAEPDDEPQSSRAAGGCVLIALAGAPIAIVFALSTDAGILAFWVGTATAVWWATRRRVSDSSATPPPQSPHPNCRKCAGQEPLSVTPSETQKGMSIYAYELPKRPGHTHVHIAKELNES